MKQSPIKRKKELKSEVENFWNEASCGENLYMVGENQKEKFINQSTERYRLEPEIIEFADFDKFKGKRTLEIGVGLGSDHQKLAEAGAILSGIDLTPRAINHVKQRFELFNLTSILNIGDAENLSFANNSFDAIYSWGVIHHSPNTQKAADEIYRVLKSGGFAKIMIYHKYSMVGFMLWIRYAFFTLKWFTPFSEIYSKYLESPGTKAYSINEAKELLKKFTKVEIKTIVGHGDLLTSQTGQRHSGWPLKIARLIWPRYIIKTFFSKYGLTLMATVVK